MWMENLFPVVWQRRILVARLTYPTLQTLSEDSCRERVHTKAVGMALVLPSYKRLACTLQQLPSFVRCDEVRRRLCNLRVEYLRHYGLQGDVGEAILTIRMRTVASGATSTNRQPHPL